MPGGQRPVPKHSAHIGPEVVIHYQWHPLHGRRVRRFYSERRAGGVVVHIEVSPGVVTAVAAWMLDAATCSSMTLGEPRAALSALRDLQQLLRRHDGVSSCHDSASITGEKHREESIETACDVSASAIAIEDGTREPRVDAVERPRAVAGRRAPGRPVAARRRRNGEGAKR